MPNDADGVSESRQSPRLRLPAMYTLIRVRPVGDDRYRWTGHIYDISETGMRFELDELIEPGTLIEVRAMLPGAKHITFAATGRVVRLHDEWDDMGPTRMGMTFDHFRHESDERKLDEFLSRSGLRAA